MDRSAISEPEKSEDNVTLEQMAYQADKNHQSRTTEHRIHPKRENSDDFRPKEQSFFDQDALKNSPALSWRR